MTRNSAAKPDHGGRPVPKAIFVAGFMGSGKSTIGRALARELGWAFVDLDEEIERREGKDIPSVFTDSGEGGFRDCEHDALREQADAARRGTALVLALGGGTYAYARNRHLMRSVGPTIWLDAAASNLWERVRHETHRPLARDRDAFVHLHRARRESYSEAECRVDASARPREVLDRILGLGWVQELLADA